MNHGTSRVVIQEPATRSDLSPSDSDGELPDSIADALVPNRATLTHLYRFTQAILIAQAFLLLWWSSSQWDHFALTYDFVVYFHAWHGFWASGLNPLNASVDHLVLANNAVFITWPLAVITKIFPHGVVLLWTQDLFVVAAEFAVTAWMFDVVVRSRLSAEQPWLATGIFGTGFGLIVLNPWVYWSTTFDFHSECVAVLFVVLAARALAERRWSWLAIWVVGIVLCGYVTATYVIGLALAALIVGGGRRRVGLAMLLCIAVLVPVIVLDPTLNRTLTGQVNRFYGYLAGRPAGYTSLLGLVVGLLVHIPRILQTIWDRAINLWANVAPSGLIGLLSPWVLGMALILLPENLLNSNPTLVAPSFQYLPFYILIPLGTVFILLRIGVHRGRWARAQRAIVACLTVALFANACAWALVWLPHLASSWVRVAPNATAVLTRVERQIPLDEEVVASQGISGRFADRQWIEPITGPGPVPVYGRRVWFILAPTQGIETEQLGAAFATVSMLAGPMRAHLVDSGSGIWVFAWNRPGATHSVNLPDVPNELPAWVSPGPAGIAVMRGAPSTWQLVDSGKPGYLLAYDYWREPLGSYAATITLSASGPVNVEVWNATGDVLLARREVPRTQGIADVAIGVDDHKFYKTTPFSGLGPFQMSPPGPGNQDRIEIRVWTSGSASVRVFSVGLWPTRSSEIGN